MKVALTPLHRKALTAGLHLLARAQEAAAKVEENAGNKEYAAGCRNLAAKVEAEQQRISTNGADPEFNPTQREWASRGLQLYTRNARASSGTMKGLLEDGIAAKMIEQADDVENNFLPKFLDQQQLDLRKPKDGKERAAGEKDDEPDEGEPQATFPSLREHAEKLEREARGQKVPAKKAPRVRHHHKPANKKR